MLTMAQIGIIPVVILLLLVSYITCLDFPKGKCEITTREDASKTFKELLYFQPQWIELHLTFTGLNVDHLTRPLHFDELSNPKMWLWTLSFNEKLAKIHLYYDSDIYTLGLINHYIKSMNVTLEVPHICQTTGLNRKELFGQVYEQLEQMVMVNESFQSLLCYEVNLCRSLSRSSPLKYRMSRYFGIMRYVHIRRCCKVSRNKTTHLQDVPWDCNPHLHSRELNTLNIIGAIIFAFSPFFILKLFGSRSQKRILLDNGTFYDMADRNTEWVKPHENISVFLFMILKILRPKRLNYFIRFFFRILFVLLTPIVLYVMIIIFYFHKYDQLRIYLIEGLPMGYLSIMFGFQRSFNNMDGFVGGPIVCLITYYLIGCILISIPENIPKAMSSHVIKQSQSWTLLQVNIEFLEKYGSVEVRRLHGFERVYGILKARLLMALNSSFWEALASLWMSRMYRLILYLQTKRTRFNQTPIKFLLLLPVAAAAAILLGFFFVLEASLCLLYYGLPISFIFFTVPKGYLVSYVIPPMRSQQFKSRLVCISLALCIIGGFPFVYAYSLYVFCTSFFIASRIVIQTFCLIIPNPEYSLYLVGILFCCYYIHGLGRQVLDNYRQLLSISIQITEKAQSEECFFAFDQPFVLVSYASEKYMRSEIFLAIISKCSPFRYELAWFLCKSAVVLFFLALSLHILVTGNAQALSFYKSVWIFFTACLPKLLNVIHKRRFCITRLEESIYMILRKPSLTLL